MFTIISRRSSLSYPLHFRWEISFNLNLTPEATYIEKHIEKNEWHVSWKTQDTEQARRILKRYQHRPEYELYDITKDPFELDNLADKIEYKQKKAELIRELESWMKQQKIQG